LDALVIALCTQNHVQYINNVNSGITNKKKEKLAAIKKQRAGIKRQIMYSQKDNENPNETIWNFMLPGSFRQENTEGSGKESVCNVKWSNASIEQDTSDYKKVVLDSLEHCIVTFKNDFKLVSKSSNKYESYYDRDGNLRTSNSGKPIKALISQENEENKHWSIRKSLHTDNPSGKIELQFDQLKIADNLGKVELINDENIKDKVKDILGMHYNKIGEAKKYLEKNPIEIEGVSIEFADFKTGNFKFRKKQPIMNLAVRTGLGALTTLDQIKDRIYKVADMKLRNDLLLHLKNNENDIDKAFSIEGIEAFNGNRKIPIKKLAICESSKLKFSIGEKLDNKHKWVETGGNYHFKIIKEEDKRRFETIPLRESIEIEKRKIIDKVEKIEEGDIIILSPNDLVYIPTKQEQENLVLLDFKNLSKEQISRIYLVNDFSGSAIYFVPYHVSSAIIPKEIDLNKNETKGKLTGSFDIKTASFEGVQIKDVCIKLKVDRLGNITEVNGKPIL
jgi:CRISPR-associated endonuclease Csn1